MKSKVEELMIEILSKSEHGLTLNELVKLIREIDPSLLSGKNPNKSLYSIIYRRELKRKELNVACLFKIDTSRRDSTYSLLREL
ncbi:MAG: hypothetical protein VB956_00125 [Moraxella sp.]